jgi:hypothetical protein
MRNREIQSLPNNREQAVQRAKYLDSSLRRNPAKREHMVEFMPKILDNNHAEIATALRFPHYVTVAPLL